MLSVLVTALVTNALRMGTKNHSRNSVISIHINHKPNLLQIRSRALRLSWAHTRQLTGIKSNFLKSFKGEVKL